MGTGLMLARHATLETIQTIERAERVFHLLTNSATVAWLHRLNSRATPLGDSIRPGKSRIRSYTEIAKRIVDAARAGEHVCAVFYGHPGVLVAPAYLAIARARKLGLRARMLPGISAEDCLFADLTLDPRPLCWQSFEATDFLLWRRRFDPAVPLILWQVGMIGEPSVKIDMHARPERLRVLTRQLRRHYSSRHEVVLYEAAEFPTCDPVVTRVALGSIPSQTFTPKTTLYVPPRPTRGQDRRVARWLNE